MEEQKKYILGQFVNISSGYDEFLHEGEIRLSAIRQNLEIIISKPKIKSCPQFFNVKVIKDKNEMDIDLKAEVVKDAYLIALMDEKSKIKY